MNFKKLLAAALFALASIPAALGAQATYTTPTSGPMSFGTFVSTYLNPALAAVLSNNSGATAPAVTGQPGAYQWWVDTSTTPKTLKIYDGTSWLALATIDTSSHVLALNGSTLKLFGSSSGNTVMQPAAAASGTLTLPAATDTLIGKATTDTLTNKTFDTAGTGNNFSINGLAATANTGTGAVVRATSPTLVTPALGTPSSGTLTNATGLPISSGVSGLGAGVATFLGTPSSANLAAALTDETGTGAAVLATSPTLVTPVLGVATATSVNKLSITAPASGSTLTIADGKTLTASKSITLDGTDSTTMTFPSTSATIARTDAANTFTGHQTIEGVTSTGATGTGKLVFDTSPTLVTPALGTPSAINLTNGTALPVSGITASTSTALGVGSIELGHASDTTLTRVSAGVASIEGVNVVTTSSTDTLTNKSLTSPVATGTADVQQALKWSGDISPTQIVANTNDYAPTGFSTATTLRLSTDASRNITGLAGGAGGRVIVIHNVGAFPLVLTNQDAASTAANRFLFGGDLTLAADSSITLKYDATSSRWRALSSTAAGGGGGGSVTSVAISAGTGIQTSGTCTITTSGTCTVSMADQYRQNELMMCANQAKALAAYQRVIETFCDGYKASDGVASVTNGAVNTTSGYVGPNPGGIDANALIVLHFNGTNAATTTTDSGALAVTATANGSAQLSTAQAKFGSASSIYNSSTSTYWSIPDQASLRFGTGALTVEAWMWPVTNRQAALIGKRVNGSTGGTAWALDLDSSGHVILTDQSTNHTTTATVTTGQFNHVAWVRTGTSNYLFINGGTPLTWTDSNNYTDTAALLIGKDGNTGSGDTGFNGYIDEVRISNVARWTAAFTAPTLEYTSGPQNATIVTTTQTADTTVSSGRVLLEYDPIDSITLNTDLTVEVTCNSGTNYASATLSSVGKGQGGRSVAETADTSCTSGTGFAARIKNLNNKSVNIYKTTLTVH